MSDIAVSIILCTQNRADDLRATFASIAACRVPADMPTELLVVDNASSDYTPRVLAETRMAAMDFLPLHEPRKGKSRGINMAIRKSRGRAILFTDDDVRVPADWIEAMCRPILADQADGVMGSVKLAPHLERPWLKGMKRSWLAITDDYNNTATIMIGANMAVGRRVLEAIPGLDEELGPGAMVSADDVLFSWQFQEAGFRLLPRLDVVIEHHLRGDRLTRDMFLKRAMLEGRQEAYLFHHWLHGTAQWQRSKALVKQMQLAAMRVARGRGDDIAPDWELRLLMAIGFAKQYNVEARRPRNYPRRGLKKTGAQEALSSTPPTAAPVLERV